MKNLITFITVFLVSLISFSQPPSAISYQVVIRDANNNLIANKLVNIRCSILKGSVNSSSVYTETQTASTNENGLVSITIGEGTTKDNFSSIDWANALYFIKTETDPNNGTNFSITSQIQLLSVPFALYAKTAENTFSGDYNDLINLPKIPTKISDLTNDSGFITSSNDSDDNPTNELQELSVSNSGDTLFLRKSNNWVIIPGISDLNIYPYGTVHCTSTQTEVVDVINPITGKTWMDRNLGAWQVATSIRDQAAHGDLYQWGRGSDGHQCRGGSFNTTTITISSNNWQGVNGVNNPCPKGYRIPTITELDAERTSGGGIYNSPLKFTQDVLDSYGYYWSSTVSGSNAYFIGFDPSESTKNLSSRTNRYSVRCIKD